MKNRYDGILREHNAAILAATPAARYLWNRLAHEVEMNFDPSDFILEAGCGEGESARAVLQRHFAGGFIPAKLLLLDLSPDMISAAKAALEQYRGKVTYACADANEYLQSVDRSRFYGLIYSSWTAHNFPWEYKRVFFKSVCQALKPGGSFVLMDKVYPGDEKEADRLLNLQLRRYVALLPPLVSQAIYQHELEDYGPLYRMDEMPLRQELGKHFSEVKVVDRVERELLIVCRK